MPYNQLTTDDRQPATANHSPSLGRFTQPDTIVPNPANSQSWNRYSYVRNSPIMYNDPTGHKEDGECGYMGEQCWGETDEPIEEDVEESAGASNGADGDQSEGGGRRRADVTGWLVGTMNHEAWWLDVFADCGWDQICLYKSHLNLFGDYGKYDIERSMLNYIGEAVVLCGGATYRWVDYSTPGNILYGYLSASRDVPQWISWGAAGALEYKNSLDEEHQYTGELTSWVTIQVIKPLWILVMHYMTCTQMV